jgi:protein-disulfide isomerase
MGLDTKAFNECLDSGKHTEMIQTMTQIARQLGVQSTPTFAVNGQGVVGAQTFEAFQQIIDGYLNGTPTPSPTP